MTSNSADLPNADILIIDDKLDNLRLLSMLLKNQRYKVRSVTSGAMALTAIQAAPPDLILLDINMPGMDGYEVCRRLKTIPQTAEIPVIFISASDEATDKVHAFAVGGTDYITKPFESIEVLARIENQLKLQYAKAEIRLLNAELEDRVLKRTAQLQAANRELAREIAERKRVQEQLLHMAMHDSLTSLPNRAQFMQRLQAALKRTRQEPDYVFAVLFLDCDRFKVVNDSLGHFVGDQLLIAVAKRLSAFIQPINMLARLGGDEFTILLDQIGDIDDATHMAQKLRAEMALPFYLDQHEVFINASIGIVLGSQDYHLPEHLLRDADIAMYHAKAMGEASHKVFDANMHTNALALMQLETDLRRAVECRGFVVHYQPIVSLSTGQITGFEALVRWQHPTRGFISPVEFIPAAEETGLILPLGVWVLREACSQMGIWQHKNLAEPTLTISVNLSVKQFAQPNLIEQIDKILAETALDSRNLKLEITESAIMDNAESATSTLQQLRERQIQLSIDDFGTGYSSLSYLHHFPADILKIDRSFIHGMGDANKNREIVKAIVTLAQQLGMTVIAEGIETHHQLAHLKALGCELGQGFWFSEPLDSPSTEALLRSQPQW
ncbi:MAG: EAL domain-containing protein [Cyanothece sp. SIO1E1]|nr:EAL domain-containing protein [Cyanothece sp. SIO1E1]